MVYHRILNMFLVLYSRIKSFLNPLQSCLYHFTGPALLKFSKDLVMVYTQFILFIPYLATLHNWITYLLKHFLHVASRTPCSFSFPPASVPSSVSFAGPSSPWHLWMLKSPMAQALELFLPIYTHSLGDLIQSSSLNNCHMLTSPNFSSPDLYPKCQTSILNARPVYSTTVVTSPFEGHLKFNSPDLISLNSPLQESSHLS